MSKTGFKSKIAKFMVTHAIALEMANIVGFVTAVIGLQWYLGPILDLGYQPYEPTRVTSRSPTVLLGAGTLSREELLTDVMIWAAKVNVLNVISNVAFVISGLLTDAMLVRSSFRAWTCPSYFIIDLEMLSNMEVYPLPSTTSHCRSPTLTVHGIYWCVFRWINVL